MTSTRQISRDDRNFSTRMLSQQCGIDLVHDAQLQALIRRALQLGAKPPASHVETAARLVSTGSLGRALRALVCPALGDYGRPCRQRCCTTCCERRARRLARDMRDAIHAYRSPWALLVTAPSSTMFDLASSLETLRSGLLALRRRRWFAGAVRAGVLAIELPTNGKNWQTHAHGALDADVGGFDLDVFCERAAAEWRAITGKQGAVFDLEPLHSAAALAAYALKVNDAKTWALDALSPSVAAHVDRALRGRRLIIEWGDRSEVA